MPKGTKLGPWLFLVLINDLNLSHNLNVQLWKYGDATTTSEVVVKGSDSNAQQLADRVAQWSSDHEAFYSRQPVQASGYCGIDLFIRVNNSLFKQE